MPTTGQPDRPSEDDLPIFVGRQNTRPILCDGDGMLEVGGRLAITSDDSPAICENLDLVGSSIDHRLNRQYPPRFQSWTGSRSAIIGDLRIFVHPLTDPVSTEIPDNTKSSRFDALLNRRRDIVKPVVRNICSIARKRD